MDRSASSPPRTLEYASPAGRFSSNPIPPLKRIFLGLLICFIDINLNSFDIINDALGTLLVAISVAPLANIFVSPQYAGRMQFVLIMAWVAVLSSIAEQFMPPLTGALAVAMGMVGLLQVIAAFLFCQCMRALAQENELPQAEESWGMTALLVGWIWLAPTCVGVALSIIAGSKGMHFNSQNGSMVLLVIGMVLAATVPVIHFRISVSRMDQEIAEQFHSLQSMMS